MSTRQNLVLTFKTTVGITILNFIGGIITARLLGPQGKGELTAVILWPSMLATIGSLGITESLVYFSGKNKERIPYFFSCSIIIAVIQSIVLMTAGYFLIPHFLKQYSSSVIQICQMYLIFIPLNLVALYQLSLLQGTMKFKKFNFIRILVITLFISGIIILAFLGKVTVRNAAFIWLISNFLTLIIGLIFLLQEKLISWHFDKLTFKDLFSYGWKVHLGSMSSQLNMRLDQMLMSVFLAPAMLGFYVIATTVAGMVSLIPNVFSFVAFPSISNQSDAQEKQRLFAKYFRFSFFLTVIVCIAILIFSYWLIPLFYGKTFIESIKSCQILTLTMFFTGCSFVLASGLKALGKPLISSKAELMRLIISAIILPALLIKFQMIGAATATLIASLVSFVYLIRKSNLSFHDLFCFGINDLKQFSRLVKLSRS